MSAHAQLFSRRADRFDELVTGVPADRWSAPSPCDEWDARGVVAHVVDMLRVLAGAVGQGLSPADGEHPLASFRAARTDIETLLADPELLERTTTSPAGTMRFGELADVFGGDLVWHGWDLAKATAQDPTIDPDEVSQALPGAREFAPEMYIPEAFGPGVVVFGPRLVVADTASEERQILALLGRDADWRAPA